MKKNKTRCPTPPGAPNGMRRGLVSAPGPLWPSDLPWSAGDSARLLCSCGIISGEGEDILREVEIWVVTGRKQEWTRDELGRNAEAERRGTKIIADTLSYRCGDVPGATGKRRLREAKEPAPITVCLRL